MEEKSVNIELIGKVTERDFLSERKKNSNYIPSKTKRIKTRLLINEQTCFYCGKISKNLTLEHYPPRHLARKGDNVYGMLACRECNTYYDKVMSGTPPLVKLRHCNDYLSNLNSRKTSSFKKLIGFIVLWRLLNAPGRIPRLDPAEPND